MESTTPRRWMTVLLIIAVITVSFLAYPSGVHSQSPSPQKIESNDSRVTATGSWSTQSTAAASGGSYLYNAAQSDAVLSLDFYGPSLEVIYVSGPSLGTLAIEVDGTVLRTVITTDSDTKYAQSSKINYLTDEWHTVRLYAQEGGVVAIDALVVNLEAPAATPTPEVSAGGQATTTEPAADSSNGPRVAPTALVINEVDMGNLDAVELYNPTNSVINMTSFSLLTYGFDNALEINYNFPAFNLYPGAYVILSEGAGTNTSTHLYMVQNIGNWVHGGAGGGAVTLANAGGTAIDFVRWGTATVPAPVGQTFTGTPATPEYPNTLGRNANSDENNSSGDWYSQCATLGGPNQRCLVINEVFYGDPDEVELYNGGSSPINLFGYRLEVYDTPSTLQINYVMPSFTLQPGAFVVIIEGTGTNTATTLYATTTTTFINSGGAVILYNGATPLDFVQWGASTTPVPAGISFAGTAAPVPGLSQGSFARGSFYGYDIDRANEWCGQVNTLYADNNPCIVINEVDTGDPDSVELYNASTSTFTLTNWSVGFYNAAGTAVISFTIPAFTLASGAYVRILEGAGANTATTLFTTTTITDWSAGTGGSVVLTTPYGTYHDFVRWGNSTFQPGSQILFSGSPLPNAPAQGLSIARNRSSSDRNITEDWCIAATTLLARNIGCNAQLALFLPSSNYVSLVDTNVTPPTAPSPDDYFSYSITNLPGNPTGGQWVMGDWDGDGEKSPGVYFTSGPSAGVFYTTNTNGPNPIWTSTWFGLFAGVAGNTPVAGRFNAAIANDCLGVQDSQNFPPYGTAFALYFTCSTAGGNPAKTVQWNSILLPDSGGFSGTFQFGVGDFDGNGVDSVACRRGPYIAFSNTDPTTVNATFPLAQYIGVPPGSSGVSYFVVGDWDANGIASFGLYYSALGRLYFRNDLAFNSGVYGYQDFGLPLGATATAATWAGY